MKTEQIGSISKFCLGLKNKDDHRVSRSFHSENLLKNRSILRPNGRIVTSLQSQTRIFFLTYL